MPPRPCVPITTRSQGSLSAYRTISAAGDPSRRTRSTGTPVASAASVTWSSAASPSEWSTSATPSHEVSAGRLAKLAALTT